MTEAQTTLDADAFGEDLRERVAEARAVQERCQRLLAALNEQRSGEWQPAAIDEAAHYAALAIRHADDGDRYDRLLASAEASLTAAEAQFDDVDVDVDMRERERTDA